MKHIPCCQDGVDLILSLWPLESESRSVVPDSLWSHGLYSLWNSPGQNTGVGSLSLLQGNLPNPGIKPRSPALQVDSSLSEPPGKPYDHWSSQQSICSTTTSNTHTHTHTHTPHTTPHHTNCSNWLTDGQFSQVSQINPWKFCWILKKWTPIIWTAGCAIELSLQRLLVSFTTI